MGVMLNHRELDRCPRCGSLDCDVYDWHLDGKLVVIEGGCNDCGARWEDKFVYLCSTITTEPKED